LLAVAAGGTGKKAPAAPELEGTEVVLLMVGVVAKLEVQRENGRLGAPGVANVEVTFPRRVVVEWKRVVGRCRAGPRHGGDVPGRIRTDHVEPGAGVAADGRSLPGLGHRGHEIAVLHGRGDR